MTIVLGIDPGKTIGACVLEVTGDVTKGRRARRLHASSSHHDSPQFRPWLAMLFGCARHNTDFVVALEEASMIFGKPTGAQAHMRATGLVMTAKVSERIATLAEVAGHAVVRLPSTRARSLIVGKPNASDATIAMAVKRLVVDWPARSNAHVRDAAVVALAVGHTYKPARVA